jgi:UDPglucose 6-dehydrogenase
MRITVAGTGYVGLVTGVCLADTGNHVIGVDVDAHKIARLKSGEPPIFEPGLRDLLTYNLAAGRLTFTTDLGTAVRQSDIIFVAVGTPPREDGSADLAQVEAVTTQIARQADGPKIVVIKSTVPVGACDRLAQQMAERAAHPITVVSNPEFLKEGTAVDDFQRPDRVVIGASDHEAAAAIRELYEPFVRNKRPILIVSRSAAEMIKYAANCYLATRISFINQIAELCAPLGVNVDEVRLGIGYDNRIGFHFLYPGIGYGGSCFPKDIPALRHVGKQAGVEMTILDAVHRVNEHQPMLLLRYAQDFFKGRLSGHTFAVWGVAFKPRTDDIREAPALKVIDALLAAGAKVRAHDPKALPHLRRAYGERLTYCDDGYDAASGADGLFICTEWNEFRSPDFERLRAALKHPVIFDGRNLFSPEQVKRHQFDYFSIGRPAVRRA